MHTSLSSSRKHLQQEENFLRAAAAVRAELQNAMNPVPPDPRTTKGITHEQRYYLCLKKQDCPAMKQAELAAWFLETYSFPISQPTISHSLKKSAEIIARGISTPGLEPTRVRRRPVRHPELEQALFQWVQQQQEQQLEQERRQEQSGDGSDPISGPALVRQAKKIAQEMNIHDTVFCPGWLSRFKMRYGITPSRGSSQPENHHRHHHLNHAHHPHHPHPHQRRHRHHQLPEQQQQQLQQPQQQPQSEFEAPIQTVSSITISNHSCSPPPSEDYSLPQSDTLTPRNTLDSTALGTIEIRPSIAVPASINSSHSSLQQLRPQHTGFGPVHILPSSGDLDRQSLHQQRQQYLQQQQQQQQQQDAQLLQQFRMQTFQPATSRTTHLHPHNQQRQQHQQTLTDFQPVSGESSPSPSLATSASKITAAMHLEFLQSIPITTPTNGTGSFLHVPSSLPPSPLSHHAPGSLLRSPNDPFQSSSIVARTDAMTSTSSSTGGSKLDSSVTLGKVQTLQEAQRLVQLLRQYAGSNLQDPTGALKSLESLEWELDPTKMRGSITISEMGDDQD
ncbi:hypothetical protein BG015_007296 [Linnemannia schmuckeri]|uniref:HTH CENPB-type domain-containing protein n=1 Tax=Linnemannia schmuckeri TaxID=64567 RepID=A0A9P5RZD8_9FUNG|nr:hypothetical protein BG015_007296 [Linnemannia schmuckeri]